MKQLRFLGLILVLTTGHLLPGVIHDAALSGQYYKIKRLLRRGGDPNERDKDGNTALHHAKSPSYAQLLYDYKANLNLQNIYGLTPLHVAVVRGKWRLVKKLISLGANVNVGDADGITPLHLATAISYLKNKSALTSPLDPSMAGPRAIVGAALTGVTGVITASGASSLFTKAGAVEVARRATVKIAPDEAKKLSELLKRARTASIASTTSLSKRWAAARIEAASAVQSKAPPTRPGILRSATLRMSIAIGLLATALSGIVAVDMAIRYRILDLLLQAGAKVNAQDQFDNTPLHTLADGQLFDLGNRRGGRWMAQILIKHGADPLIRNTHGKLPYDLAKEHYRWTLFGILRPGAVLKRRARQEERR